MPHVQPGPRRRRPSSKTDAPSGTWLIRLRVWIEIAGHGTLGPGKLRLLEAVENEASLSAAARKLRMSYRLAWEHLRQIERRTGITVVEPRRGGRHGGGTELTPQGRLLLKKYRELRSEVTDRAEEAFARHFRGWQTAERDRT